MATVTSYVTMKTLTPDLDPRGPSHLRTLEDPVGGGGGTGGNEPLPDSGVHAAARGVFRHAGARGERTQLEGVFGSLGPGADLADHRVRDEGQVGSEAEDFLDGCQLEHGPAGSDVDPLVGQDPFARDAECGHDPLQIVLVECAGHAPGRGGEGQSILAAAHGDQASGTLLHEVLGVLRGAAAVQPGTRGAEGGVPSERQLAPRA